MSVVETLPLRPSYLQTDHGAGASSSPVLPVTLCRDVAKIPVQKVDRQVEDITVLVVRTENLNGQAKIDTPTVGNLDFILRCFVW